MNPHRFGSLLAACALLAAAACNSARVTSPSESGLIKASLAQPPGAVHAIRVTVTGSGIVGDLHTDLLNGEGNYWSGTVLQVPPGDGYLVTAYAYDNGSIPADPTTDTTGLIYKGAAANVSVTAGNATQVVIVLVPYPDSNGGGGTGINTPPHIVFGAHPSSIRSSDTVELSAAAWDPDAGTLLTYTWDDGGLNGVFSGRDGIQTTQLPGFTISVDYTPPADFTGTATIRLTVTDGQAVVSRTISFGVVGTGSVDATLILDSGPEIAILWVSSQDLTPGGMAEIHYRVDGGYGWLHASWVDSCNGSFDDDLMWNPMLSEGWAWYFAPFEAPASPGQCDLTLTVTDEANASTWSRVIVWVNPSEDDPEFPFPPNQ